jgi:hypothetical protein
MAENVKPATNRQLATIRQRLNFASIKDNLWSEKYFDDVTALLARLDAAEVALASELPPAPREAADA